MSQEVITEAQDASDAKHLGLALFVICSAQLMIVLDATVVNVAIPTIQRDLHFSSSNLEWLITAYSLTFGGLLLFGGRTGDLFGKRRMFMIGVGLFAFASLLGGLAQSDIWLILTRGLQGVGGAIAAPTALSLIATNFPEGRERNRAMGVYAAMSGGGGAVGLLLGGILTSYVSWRWIFFINVPIAAIVLFLAPRALHESSTSTGKLDVPGAVTVTGGMLCLVYGLSNASSHSWSSVSTVGFLAALGILLIIFGLIERRSAAPLMPFSIFKDRNRSASFAMMLCIGIALFSMFYFLTLFLQNIEGYSAVKTGVGFLPMTVGIIVAAGVTSQLRRQDRHPRAIDHRTGDVGGGHDLAHAHHALEHVSRHLGPLIIIALGMGLRLRAPHADRGVRRRWRRGRTRLGPAQHDATGRWCARLGGPRDGGRRREELIPDHASAPHEQHEHRSSPRPTATPRRSGCRRALRSCPCSSRFS